MTIVDAAVRAARNANNAMRGKTVTYKFYAGGSVVVTAVVGDTVSETETEQHVVREEKTVDFIIDHEALGVEPARNDRIIWDGRTYTVTGILGSKVFEYHDFGRSSYRIHTVQTPDELISTAAYSYGAATGEAYGTPTGEGYSGP